MEFNYKVKMHNVNKISNVKMEFTPYENLISSWNGVETGWVSDDASVLATVDINRKLFDSPTLSLVLSQDVNEGNIYKDFTCEPNKTYMVSAYVRNNGVLTTGLRVGTSTDWSSNFFTNRLVCTINSNENTSIRVNLDLFYHADLDANVWLGGLFITEIPSEDASLTTESLSQKYVYTEDIKESPSMKDILAQKYHGSPFSYFLTMDGIKISSYTRPLARYGVDENTILESFVNEIPTQIFYTFINSVALMAMLEGDVTRVSHTYPKMQSDDIKVFPRVQYFGGFEVSSARADNKPLANNVTMTINIYTPITKVTNSMQDSMISAVVTDLMGELGYSAIRGSDYFREPEQLYVRQTQYVKDIHLSKKVKS